MVIHLARVDQSIDLVYSLESIPSEIHEGRCSIPNTGQTVPPLYVLISSFLIELWVLNLPHEGMFLDFP